MNRCWDRNGQRLSLLLADFDNLTLLLQLCLVDFASGAVSRPTSVCGADPERVVATADEVFCTDETSLAILVAHDQISIEDEPVGARCLQLGRRQVKCVVLHRGARRCRRVVLLSGCSTGLGRCLFIDLLMHADGLSDEGIRAAILRLILEPWLVLDHSTLHGEE